ncbi:MAG: sigma-70 family RNA polymerase sigma factor [Proteobacteria bacterium]|nr:sigma-70 family RNA polymerase sigma factor [Pseudomonadota bacterium]
MSSAKDQKKENIGEDPDADLVSAFQSGNTHAFDQLVLRYKDRIFNLCYRSLGDYQEAYDTAQEIFIKVYKNLKSFRGEASFLTWLYTIAGNTCKNKLKSLEYRYRNKKVSLHKHNQEGGNQDREIEDESGSPQVVLEKKEKMKIIQGAIDSLPAEQKMVVVLRDIEGLSYDEIINITGHRLGTVKSKLSRARLILREKLRGIIKG